MDKPQKFIFSPVEKKLLVEILKKYSGIVENKQTDGATLRQKNEAWNAITREFNASPLTSQHVKHQQLRKLWQNIKQRQRDALTKERQHRFATGGGPALKDADIDPDVSQVTPALIVGIENAMDSDTTELEYSVVLESPNLFVPDPTPSTSTASDPLPSTSSAPDSTPSTSQTPVTPTPPPFLLQTQTPPLRPLPSLTPPPPPHRSHDTAAIRGTVDLLRKEYEDRQQRLDELHQLQKELLQEQIKEARAKTEEAQAKAELAQFILHNHKSGQV